MIHPRIEEFIHKLKSFDGEDILSLKVLELLKKAGATRTEATIVIHQGFKISDEKADAFVINSGIWPIPDLQDIFYETLKYMCYNPNDPNYTDDGNKISVSL